MFAFLRGNSTEVKWNTKPHQPGVTTRECLMQIGDSIWYSSSHKSHYQKGENGMSEYCMKSNRIVQTIQYPEGVRPKRHCCCVHQNEIYIIDGENGKIIVFDPESKSFTEKQTIPKIGTFPNAVVISNTIRIFHGHTNDKHDIVYDITKDSVQIHEGGNPSDKMDQVSSIYYDSNIYAFGGSNYTRLKRMDTFKASKKNQG